MVEQAAFRDADCAVGGCSCGIWEDWQIALRDYAQAHPRAAGALDGITDDDAAAEAIDDLMVELEGEFVYHGRPCPRVGCPRHDATRNGASA